VRFALVVALALSVWSCGSSNNAPKCTISSCAGCCDENDTCQAGTIATACGTGGKLCSACPSGQDCVSKSCQMMVVTHCDTANCAGCCDSSDQCQPGDQAGHCGGSGGACVTCMAPQTCNGGTRTCQ
jgi:hypothetical protein